MDERIAWNRARASGNGGADTPAVATAVHAAQQGNSEGLRYLYVRYAENVYGLARSIVGNDREAEGLTQQVFADLPGRIQKYETGTVPFLAWLLRVSRNASESVMRSRRGTPTVEWPNAPQAEWGQSDHLGSALAALPAEQRAVLVMRHLDGLTPVEIADRLGKPEAAIHGLHHRARLAVMRDGTAEDFQPYTPEARPSRRRIR